MSRRKRTHPVNFEKHIVKTEEEGWILKENKKLVTKAPVFVEYCNKTVFCGPLVKDVHKALCGYSRDWKYEEQKEDVKFIMKNHSVSKMTFNEFEKRVAPLLDENNYKKFKAKRKSSMSMKRSIFCRTRNSKRKRPKKSLVSCRRKTCPPPPSRIVYYENNPLDGFRGPELDSDAEEEPIYNLNAAIFHCIGSKAPLFKTHREFYPPPKHSIIVEPCAGGAFYSLYHCQDENVKQVILFEKNEKVCEAWRWLIEEATEQFLQDLPLLDWGDTTLRPEFDHLPLGAKFLMGYNINAVRNTCNPYYTAQKKYHWSNESKLRLIRLLPFIQKKFMIAQAPSGDFLDVTETLRYLDDREIKVATFFIDPPYALVPGGYKEEKNFPFAELSRIIEKSSFSSGQFICCEGALEENNRLRVPEWLGTHPYRLVKKIPRTTRGTFYWELVAVIN